jgi:hypothetical protein
LPTHDFECELASSTEVLLKGKAQYS